MNYFELHIGDYASVTSHLSLVEDGVYIRLLRRYYRTEMPLPADPAQVARLCGAREQIELKAVHDVLHEFFVLGEDGWHNKRADEDIATFHEAEPEREAKRENMKERQRRTRERRASLFAQLREYDIVPAWDTPMGELSRMLSRVTGVTSDVSGGVTGVTGQVTSGTVTRDATATHTHTPNPPPNSSVGKGEAHTEESLRAEIARACVLMRKAGCPRTNPGHIDLRNAILEGVTPEVLEWLIPDAIKAGKTNPFAYVITTARAQRQQGISIVPGVTHATSSPSGKLSAVDQVVAAIARRGKLEGDFGGDDPTVVSVVPG